MKYKLNKPDINSADCAKINFLAQYMGWIFKFNIEKQFALLEVGDGNVGYIQKDDNDQLFIVWKIGEKIEYVDNHINNIRNMENLLNFPKKLKYLLKLLMFD